MNVSPYFNSVLFLNFTFYRDLVSVLTYYVGYKQILVVLIYVLEPNNYIRRNSTK